MNKTENEQYWKKRALDKMSSVLNQLHVDFKTINDDLEHVGCSTKKVKEKEEKVYLAFADLLREIPEAEVKDNG